MGDGTTIESGCGPFSGASECSLIVSTSVASRSRLRSTRCCQTPWRPGLFSAAMQSSQITPGAGHSNDAVTEQ